MTALQSIKIENSLLIDTLLLII